MPGVRAGNFLAENIGGNFGVDEFSIKSGSGKAGAASDPANAALVIGLVLVAEALRDADGADSIPEHNIQEAKSAICRAHIDAEPGAG